jgi:ubiquinone/menaquinone biosynthesis C-methylase UbiE
VFTDPLKNLNNFEIREDMILVDLGAGTGFYSISAAHMVPKGKVYAIDINQDFLKTIRHKAKDLYISNLECFWADVEKKYGTKLADNIADRVIASNILFQVDDKDNFLKEAYRILKPGGKLLLIDPQIDSLVLGKHKHKAINRNEAHKMLEVSGLKWERDILAGNHHYGMIFSKHKK